MIGKYLTIAKNGLWTSNTTLVQMLGLCPTLAVTNSAVNALGMGLATTAVLTVSNTLISAVRKTLRPEIRIAVFVLILAGLVTSLELVMEAFVPDIYSALGIFIPLIVTNCIIIGRAESFASRHPVGESFTDGLFTGLGFSIVLFVIGSIREVIGTGHWLAGFDQLIGDAGKSLETVLFSSDSGALIAILPPGAFITLGFLVALHNVIESKGKNGKSRNSEAGHGCC